jgi:outer membrane immunogenic protein
MKMKLRTSLLLASAAIAVGLSTGAASAQDWNGFYAGVNVGIGDSDQSWDHLVVPGFPDQDVAGNVYSSNHGGFEGGGQLGFNSEMGPWVFGVEASFDGSSYTSHSICFGGYGDYHARCGTRSNWNADFKARLGQVVGPVLLYVTAGGELRDLSVSARDVQDGSDPIAGSYNNSSKAVFGWVAGFGFETPISDNVTAGLEYDYSSVDERAKLTPTAGSDTDIVEPFNVGVSQNTSTVTLRVNFQLD